MKIKKAMSLLVFMMTFSFSFGQTTLSPGDMAIIGCNFSPGTEELAIVTLVPIEAGTKIYISDYFWNGVDGIWSTTQADGYSATSESREGAIIWTTSSSYAAGKVFKVTIAPTSNTSTSANVTISDVPNEDISVVGWRSSSSLVSGGTGDAFFIYQGTSFDAVPSSWVFGFNNAEGFNNSTGSTVYSTIHSWMTFSPSGRSEPNSMLPTGLTNGSTAFSLSNNITGINGGTNPFYQNQYYEGVKTGTRASILAAITNINMPLSTTGTSAPQWTGGGSTSSFTPGGSIFPEYFCVLPEAFVVSGGGSFCSPLTASVNLSGSQIGVSYQLKKDGVDEGSPISGTGSALSFTNLSVSGTYTVVASSEAVSCMTTMTGNASVTINSSSNNTTTVSACDSYTWTNNSQTYTMSGTYTGTTTACVTEILELTITPSSTNTTTVSACDSYTWANNSQTYTMSGTYTGTTTDCVTEELNLTITPSSTNTITISACDSYTWANNSQTYTMSGTYTGTTTDCVTEELNLTITPTATNTTTVSACNSYTWSNNSQTYTMSGTYTGTTTDCVTEELVLTIQNELSWYLDADSDGFGNDATLVVDCVSPGVNYINVGGDCNDNDNTIYPGAPEVCFDGILQNCNGTLTDGCAPVLVDMISAYCGVTLPYVFSSMTAALPNLPSGTMETGYRFEITNLTTSEVRELERPIRNFKLTMTDIAEYGTTYNVRVAVRVNAEWQPYGAVCTMSTPSIPTTQVVSTQCGTTLPLISSTISCNTVSGATAYRFRVVNAANPMEDQTFERSLNNLKLTQLTQFPVQYNTAYNVTVQVKVVIDGNDVWSNFGSSCTITTPTFPTSEVTLAQCELIASSDTEVVNLTLVPGATVYRVRLTNTALGYVQTVDRTTRSFTLGMFTGLTAGTTYTVAISIQLGGVFGPYGKNCDITTPGAIANTRVIDTTTKEFSVVAFPNPFTNTFALDVRTSSAEKVNVSVYDMTGRLLEVREGSADELLDYNMGDRYPSGVYNIVVTQEADVKTVRVVKK